MKKLILILAVTSSLMSCKKLGGDYICECHLNTGEVVLYEFTSVYQDQAIESCYNSPGSCQLQE